MIRAISRVAVVASVVCLTAVMSLAQQTTSTETKAFEVLAVNGNVLDVRLPEGTRELTVPDDFRFLVNGQPLSVQQLKVGMKGTATITTRTTLTPVTVTEVRNGTVLRRSGSSIIVRTDDGFRSFSQGEVDKRGVTVFREGKPVQLSDLREGDRLSATIVTSQPPRVMTEREVQATTSVANAAGSGAGGASSAAAGTAPASAALSANRTTAGTAAPPAGGAPSAPAAQAQNAGAAGTLPKTASSWPLLGLSSVLLLAMGLALTVWRRLVH